MAYFRGDNYIWEDESGLHIWSKDGYDGWDNTGGCSRADESPTADIDDVIREEGFENASGVSISMDVMDEYVVMRLAQMIKEGIAIKTVDRVVNNPENFGALVLKRECKTRVWQPRFYDHIIRNDRNLAHQRQYILDNPSKWADYELNPRGS